jgi:hypothetical protein
VGETGGIPRLTDGNGISLKLTSIYLTVDDSDFQLNKPEPTVFSHLITNLADENKDIFSWVRNKQDVKNIMEILLVHFDLFDSKQVSERLKLAASRFHPLS